MEKSIPIVNQKRSSQQKQPKTKKKQHHHPLKVVYITNPIKFKAAASEFRALVQELTGQDADMSDTSTWFSADDGGAGGGEEAKVGAEENVHEMDSEVGRNGSDPSGFGSSYDDVFYRPEMIDGFGPGSVGCHEAAAHADFTKP